MPNARGWTQLLLVIVACIPLSCASNLVAVAEGSGIQMQTYSLGSPAGNGWKMQRDQTKDTVQFRRDDPLTIIGVVPGYLRGTPDPTEGEDRVVAMILAGEVKNMTDRGKSRS